MNWFTALLVKSEGFKRTVAAVLAALYGIVSAIPELQLFQTVLEQIAALFDITGIAHAAVGGGLSKVKLSTISAVLSALLVLSQYIPALQPFAPMLLKLASIIGALGAGTSLGTALEVKRVDNASL